jgi:tetratricopeptide (TPR) repeat protein
LRLYDSVIAKLAGTSDFSRSSALAHAYRARSKYYLDVKEYESARRDALEAIQIRSSSASKEALLPSELKAYRLLADAEEAVGNYEKAIQAIQEWKQLDHSSRTKLNGEIQRLMYLKAERRNACSS